MKIDGLASAMNGTQERAQAQYDEGVKVFKIRSAVEQTGIFDWATFHVALELMSEGIPFDIKFDLAGSGPSNGKKGTLFKLSALLMATGVAVDNEDKFNIKDLEGKFFKAYLYKNDAGYARVHDIAFKTSDSDSYITSRFKSDLEKGFVRQLSPQSESGFVVDDDDDTPPF